MKLVMVRINAGNITNLFKLNDLVCEVGDYVIVENMKDYDLGKVVAIVETNEELVKYIHNKTISKSVVRKIEI